jgi:sortase B
MNNNTNNNSSTIHKNNDFIIYEFDNKITRKDSGLDKYYDYDDEFEYLNYEINLKDYAYLLIDKLKYLLKNKTALLFLFIICLIIYFVSVFYLSRYFIYEKRTKNISEDLINKVIVEENNTSDNNEVNVASATKFDVNDDINYANTKFLNIDFNTLLFINSDTVGWLKIDNTNINYPVVKSSNNSYYLNHSFDKTTNKNGWIFMDYRNDSYNFNVNTIIYGHNMRTETMFSTLKNVKEPSWYENTSNLTIRYSTPTIHTLWQIFSIYTIEKETKYLTTSFYDDASLQSFFNEITQRSIYDFNVKLTTSDKILTLSTCDQNSSNKRLVVHAKLISTKEY